jgi:pimeloyl-ACP methyl ester carboxylesterase/leucyl aminopeptidase (aminopeptidase T)
VRELLQSALLAVARPRLGGTLLVLALILSLFQVGEASGRPAPENGWVARERPLQPYALTPDTLHAVRVNGVELHYTDRGAGEPIVFVHGGLVDYREWEPVAELLSDQYRTVNYSRRYNFPNRNPMDTREHSAAVEAEDLAELVRELDLGPVHIAGISYGAYSALLTALRHPELVRSLVLVEAPLVDWAVELPDGRELHDAFMRMWRSAGAAYERGDSIAALSAAIDWFVAPGAIERIPPGFVAALLQNIHEWGAITTSIDPFPRVEPAAARSIGAPILMISGGRSYPLFRLVDDALEQHLTTGRRHIVVDGTHDVCSEQPETCAALIREFLRDEQAASEGVGREPAPVDPAATHVVRRSARVQPGELVWIVGGSDDVPFMEELALAVGAEGGHPVATLSSDEVLRRWYQVVPERFDQQRDEWLWRMHELADVVIELQSTDYSIFREIPPERLDAWYAANAGLLEVTRQRGGRVIRIGNGLMPTEALARLLGVERVDLERAFRAGLLADPSDLAASGEHLREVLRGASTLRVQHPNGTDITVGIGRGRIVVIDGTTSLGTHLPREPDELDITWLPGGEVTLALDPERAEGRLVVERLFLDGQAIEPFVLTYSDGRMQALESDGDVSVLHSFLDPDVPLSDRLTGVKFGVNPHVTDERVLPWMGAGMFSLSMGSNVLLGGDLELPFYIFLTLPGATVHVDDRVVVQNGRLTL